MGESPWKHPLCLADADVPHTKPTDAAPATGRAGRR